MSRYKGHKFTSAEKLVGFGMIGSVMTIERMSRVKKR